MSRRHQSLSAVGLLAVVGLLLLWYGHRTVTGQHGVAAPTAAGRPDAAAPTTPGAERPRGDRHAPVPASTPGSAGTPEVLASGSGSFTPAAGGGPLLGTAGRLVRYEVLVEDGAGVDPAAFATAVDGTLADPRGWTAARRWYFQRVPAGAPADVLVHLATPGTTERMCSARGVYTGGEVSCRGGRDIVINLRRWLLGVPWYADSLDDYRHMVVNHEMGHFLGYGHAACPGVGRPAPVMQRQSVSLDGCVRNPWPYPDGLTFVTGPDAAN